MTQPTSLDGFVSSCPKTEPFFVQKNPMFLLNWRICMFSFGSNLSVTDNNRQTNKQTDRRTMKNLSPLHHRPQRGNYILRSETPIFPTKKRKSLQRSNDRKAPRTVLESDWISESLCGLSKYVIYDVLESCLTSLGTRV